MSWAPLHPDDFPTLGFGVIDWMMENLCRPDTTDPEPFVPTQEQAEFILRLYELDPKTGARTIRRGVLSRPRGWGKSPFLMALGLAEGLGPVVFDYWDEEGQPVGKPMSTVRDPIIAVAAASEEQTRFAWEPAYSMIRPEAPLHMYHDIEVMGGQINLPRGYLYTVTSSTTSTKGARMTMAICDQTEQWVDSNGGHKLYTVLKANTAKTNGLIIESPNAYTPGEDSVAERSAKAYLSKKEGRSQTKGGLLYDHREPREAVDLMDEKSLMRGLRFAYGCSSAHPDGCVLHDPPCPPGWAPVLRYVDEIGDDDMDESTARADYLNQITASTDSWIAQHEWAARKAPEAHTPVKPGDVITMGFDGSRGRAKGKPDATALIGCRVADGFVFRIGVWEAPEDKKMWADWQPPIPEIEAAIAETFRDYKVAGFYADPGKDWTSHVGSWEAKFGSKVQVKARRDHPFEWWMTGGRSATVEAAIEACESAIRLGDMTHDNSYDLTRHVLNARRRISKGRLGLAKSGPSSPKKIDAAVAMVLAWQARLDALSSGVKTTKKVRGVRRIR